MLSLKIINKITMSTSLLESYHLRDLITAVKTEAQPQIGGDRHWIFKFHLH
jgi:hypothetical protein